MRADFYRRLEKAVGVEYRDTFYDKEKKRFQTQSRKRLASGRPHRPHTNSAFERSRAYKKFSKSILKNHIQTKNIIFFKFYVRASSSYIRIERVVQAPPGYPCLGPAADPTESVLCSGSVGGFEKSPANCPVD